MVLCASCCTGAIYIELIAPYSGVNLSTMFVDSKVGYSYCKPKMMSFGGQASWARMASAVGKLTALVCHPTKKVNKAE